MKKLGGLLLVCILLTGCNEYTIEDNSPDWHERKEAMRDCDGEYIIDKAPFDVRLACTEAIYGGK